LSPAPLYHTAPSVWSMQIQAAGITTVVLEKFDAEGCLDAIQQHKITQGQFVPVMFTRMLKLPEDVRNSYDMSSLRRVMHAAAPCPVEIKKQMIDWWGPIVDEYYASSEAIGATVIFAEDWLTHPGSVGKPMNGLVHILDEDGARRLRAYMFADGHLNTDVVGRDAAWIAGQAGLRVTPKTRVLIAPFDDVITEEMLAHEKLSPVLG
nr:AMP-binding protein [Streptomyces sp. DSM 41633]